MFGNLFEGPHLLFIGALLLLIFGGKKLPELGKGLGEGLRGFKEGMKGIGADDANKTGDTSHLVTPKAEEPVKEVSIK